MRAHPDLGPFRALRQLRPPPLLTVGPPQVLSRRLKFLNRRRANPLPRNASRTHAAHPRHPLPTTVGRPPNLRLRQRHHRLQCKPTPPLPIANDLEMKKVRVHRVRAQTPRANLMVWRTDPLHQNASRWKTRPCQCQLLSQSH